MEDRPTAASEELEQLHPADLADHLQRLEADERRAVMGRLPVPVAAAALAEMEEELTVELLEAYTPEQLTELFHELPPHEAADLAAHLPEDRRGQVLARLPREDAKKLGALLRYPEDTAGGIMSDRFIALRADHTLQQTQALLRVRGEEEAEDVSYLYVTDADQKLVGVVSLRDLVFRRPERRIEEIMDRDVKFVYVDADQEQIAREFQHYHYLGLPVLERDGRLVGVVRANDALGILQEEATEDMQLMVGLSGEERALSPWPRSVRRRLPWLYVNMATAFLAASVVGFFEDTIARWTLLAVFMPIVAGMGGNAGAQTLTIIIRDMALGELSPGDGRRALVKEVFVGLINGMAIGLVVGALGYLWKGEAMLGVIVGLAMVLNLMAAALSGVLIPYGLKFLKVDPALASSIFVTTVTDVAGFFFFLGLATLSLRWVGM